MSEQAISKQLLLDTVEQSPQAVAVHDKAAWKSIFARYHVVEDPVGSRPHYGGIYDPVSGQRGDGALDRFYDTFIAPNKIRFEVLNDIVYGHHVVRDLNIHIEMSDKLSATVPMHLLYELCQEKGSDEWRIQRLAAHWELMPMMAQIFSKGFACLPVLSGLTMRMFKFQKISGMLGFCKAAFGVGKKEKDLVAKIEGALKSKNEIELFKLLDNLYIDEAFLSETNESFKAWLNQGVGQFCFTKVLAAGNTITASCQYEVGSDDRQSVMFFEFNNQNGRLVGVKLYQ